MSRKFMTLFRSLPTVAFTFLLLISANAWSATAIPPVALVPLNQIVVPEPPNLFQYVKNKAAAIRLGKAFFWDMQVGSDGVTACATCHFSAGTDNRLKNTLNPGTNAGDSLFDIKGPNQTLSNNDFPFHERQTPVDFKASPVLRDANDIVGSQGVRLNQLMSITPGVAEEAGSPLADQIFNVGGVNIRQVTGRNTPSVINAVFNFTNFWDGRASAFFNGSSPFGPLDQNAGIWVDLNGTLTKQPVSMDFASLASQATGPPLNEVEMSFRGRTFPQLGRKMLGLTPLGKQLVHPDDSELGNLSRASLQPDGTASGSKGLNTSYNQMIKDAFQNYLWNSANLTQDGFSQMEANFPLFWGLAIQLYEATLVSDDTPFDRFLGGDSTALTSEQQDGFNIFFGVGRCDVCHAATELTNASVRASRYITDADHGLLEVMPVASGQQIVYDNGFNNTAVRPTTEDVCRASLSPFDNPLTGTKFPLSFSDLAKLQKLNKLPFSTPELIPGLPATFPVANGGAFKVPGLRNVELTAPFMHNGSMRTLEEVVDFYARGGNFPTANKANLDINIVELPGLQGEPAAKAALVAFMKSMTDERIRNSEAPFDHPEMFIPNGDSANDTDMIHLPAIGMMGAPIPTEVSITSSLASPQIANTPIIFTATGQGGSGNYEYRFWINSGSGYTIVQNYSPTNTFTWTPTTAGAYDVLVDMRNAGTTVMRDASAKILFYQIQPAVAPGITVNLTSDLASPGSIGTPVTFTATGQGGSGAYEYRFWINSGSGYSVVQNYSTTNSYVWTPAAAGAYDILVDVRNAGTSVQRDAFARMLYYKIVPTAATGVTVTTNLASPVTVGTPVTFTATGQGGSGTYEYRFWINSGSGYSVVQNYSTTNSYVWTPAAAGAYDILVDVRNAGTSVQRDAFARILYYKIVPAAATGVTVTPDLASPGSIGTPVTFTAVGQGGSGNYEYRFWLNSGSGYSIVQNYSPTNTFVWTPTATGAYDILVDVRNTGSSALREAFNKLLFYRIQ